MRIGDKIVGYCDYGVIGHPIWQILADMRMSGGRLYQLLAFIGRACEFDRLEFSRLINTVIV